MLVVLLVIAYTSANGDGLKMSNSIVLNSKINSAIRN
jgi:hypothetical protein